MPLPVSKGNRRAAAPRWRSTVVLALAAVLLAAVPAGAASGWNGFGGTTVPGANWQPYADSSPFNQRADSAAVHPNSASIVSTTLSLGTIGNLVAGTAGQSNDWGHPTFYAQPTDPLFTLEATGSPRAIDGMQIRIPDDAQPSSSADGHMTVVSPDGWEYDFWQVQSKPAGGGTMTFTSGGRTRIDGDGLGSGATGALFGNAAGMIRGAELAAGHIDHALYIVVKCAANDTSFGYGTTTSRSASFVYPAKGGERACNAEDPDLPPLGARFQLAMSDSQIAALAVPAWKKTILTALADYGGYVADTGGPGFGFMFESGTSYAALGLADPLVTFAQQSGVPTWNDDYVFNMANGVDWARYLRVLVPPGAAAPAPAPSPTPSPTSWNGFGVDNWPSAAWRPYASSSPFNRSTAGVSVHPNSATMVSATLALGTIGHLVDAADETNDWAHPTFYAKTTDPVFTLHALKGSTVLEGMKIRIPDAARPAAGGDGHMTVVAPDGWEYDFWQVVSKPAGGGTMTFNGGGRTRIDGYGLGSFGTAAGFGNLAGVIRAQELAAGHIDHALFIVLKCTGTGTSFGYGVKTVSQSWDGSYVYPATHPASSCGLTNALLPPAGARFMLAMTDAQIAALSVPAWKKTILTALADYGGYVGDTGGSGFNLMFESSTTYTAFGRPDPLAAFAKANGVPMWNGQYVFNIASGVDWARYLRVLVPPSP